jgi:hypothetical protein
MAVFANPRHADTADPVGAGEPRGQLSRAVLPRYLFISALGVCGFIGLLVGSHDLPAWAAPLRIAALVWFLGFGVIRAALIRRR